MMKSRSRHTSEVELNPEDGLENAHLPIDSTISSVAMDPLPSDASKGLMSMRAIFYLLMWYFFSALTLYLNKYLIATIKTDPTLLSTVQMVSTTLLGLLQMYFPCGMYKPVHREKLPPKFYRNMIFVGGTRFLTVFLGLVALRYVAVSFTETIKSSAPIFTVAISWLVTGEYTGLYTQLSLIPIMSGLALCSAYELSFNVIGFLGALGANVSECLQNVYSKMLISGEKFKYTPGEMQFYTSAASTVIQIPTALLLMDFVYVYNTMSLPQFFMLIANGCFFHFQTISAYVLMGYISPVTHSVANTVKRALLIWVSVPIFGNPITLLSGLGTMIVTVGVLMYNKARDIDEKRKLRHHKTNGVADI